MVWMNWILPGILALLFAAVLLLVISSLLSLDWQRAHRAESASLPRLGNAAEQPDGLVLVEAGGLCFRVRVANLSSTGDAVIMLHGFPQTSAAWEPLFTAAAAKGYRVIALDQRGYSPGARPRGRDQYTIDKLIADVLGIADAFGLQRFHLAGHDWGAAVGWGVVMSAPERLLSWTALSIAHSYAFGEAVRSDPDQRRRSRYFLLFRMPLLPELLLSFNRLQVFRRVMYRWMPAGHAREYMRVFSEPGALSAVLNWYRAVGRGGTGGLPAAVTTPFLFLWGNRDPAAGRRAVDLQEQYIRGPYEKIELDAGHWLLERRTGIVVDAILGHLKRNSTRPE